MVAWSGRACGQSICKIQFGACRRKLGRQCRPTPAAVVNSRDCGRLSPLLVEGTGRHKAQQPTRHIGQIMQINVAVRTQTPASISSSPGRPLWGRRVAGIRDAEAYQSACRTSKRKNQACARPVLTPPFAARGTAPSGRAPSGCSRWSWRRTGGCSLRQARRNPDRRWWRRPCRRAAQWPAPSPSSRCA